MSDDVITRLNAALEGRHRLHFAELEDLRFVGTGKESGCG